MFRRALQDDAKREIDLRSDALRDGLALLAISLHIIEPPIACI